jgi:hypothetical protein
VISSSKPVTPKSSNVCSESSIVPAQRQPNVIERFEKPSRESNSETVESETSRISLRYWNEKF